MKLSEVKQALQHISELKFVLPDGSTVPSHFHITEVGQALKHYIDCGGTVRNESKIMFQLFTADDIDHRLQARKLAQIIEVSENQLNLQDGEVEVEYQGETIGTYSLNFDGTHFHLQNKFTDCLAKESCGIPVSKPKKRIRLGDLTAASNGCEPGTGCC